MKNKFPDDTLPEDKQKPTEKVKSNFWMLLHLLRIYLNIILSVEKSAQLLKSLQMGKRLRLNSVMITDKCSSVLVFLHVSSLCFNLNRQKQIPLHNA